MTKPDSDKRQGHALIGGLIGAIVGSSIGIAAAGTAIAGTIPLAIIGAYVAFKDGWRILLFSKRALKQPNQTRGHWGHAFIWFCIGSIIGTPILGVLLGFIGYWRGASFLARLNKIFASSASRHKREPANEKLSIETAKITHKED